MPRLKSRNHFPPNGWKFYQPQTQWELPGNLSFNAAVLEIIQHRKQKSAFLKNLKLPIEYDAVSDELDEFNAARCINSGHHHFVATFQSEPSSFFKDIDFNDASYRIDAVNQWLGPTTRPVSKDLAIKRADVCLRCPNNVSLNQNSMEEEALLGIRDNLQLQIPKDSLLKRCRVTDRLLQLGVHVQIEHIVNRVSDSQFRLFEQVVVPPNGRCWISEEAVVGNIKPTINRTMITVILPFCNKDAALMRRQIEWMGTLGGARDHNAILAYDHTTRQVESKLVEDIAKAVFKSVSVFNYPVPESNHVTRASKHAICHVAKMMEETVQTPWIWWEADMTALKPGFMTTIQNAYQKSGKLFFGPIVPDMGHMNGTAVYPPNTFSLCPSLRLNNGEAFDCGMRSEMHSAADAYPLIYHVWCIRGDRLCPHGDGVVPSNITRAMLSQIPSEAVAFHRCKDDSIIKLLRKS